MTIEQLLEIDADTLEKMTDAQLMDFFKPYLVYVKPDKHQQPQQVSKTSIRKNNKQMSTDANMEKAKMIAKQMGIDFESL